LSPSDKIPSSVPGGFLSGSVTDDECTARHRGTLRAPYPAPGLVRTCRVGDFMKVRNVKPDDPGFLQSNQISKCRSAGNAARCSPKPTIAGAHPGSFFVSCSNYTIRLRTKLSRNFLSIKSIVIDAQRSIRAGTTSKAMDKALIFIHFRRLGRFVQDHSLHAHGRQKIRFLV
jgi:hypothetical protein